MRGSSRRLEPRNWLPILVWVVALAMALNTGWATAYRFFYLFTIIVILALYWSSGPVFALSIRRTSLVGAAHVGEYLTEQVQVQNRSPLPQLWVALEDESELPLHALRRVITYIPPRATRTFLVRTPAVRRGRYRLGPSHLTGGDPFGLFRTHRRLAYGATTVVYPRLFNLPILDRLIGPLPTEGRQYRRSPLQTPDVTTVREYQPGDEFNRIHWPSTARLGRLISKNYEENPGGDVWIVLDLHQAVQAGRKWSLHEMTRRLRRGSEVPLDPSTEEYAISLAASTARHCLLQGRSVGLVSHAQRRLVVQPDRGERQEARLYDLLAVTTAQGTMPLAMLLQRESPNFRWHDSVIIITPSDRPQWVAPAHSLALRGVHLLVLLVERGTFEGGGGGDEPVPLLLARRILTASIANGLPPEQAAIIGEGPGFRRF